MATKGEILIVSLYVDDLVYTGNNENMMNEFRDSVKKEFSMTGLGRMKYYLSIEVIQCDEGIYIGHRKYAMEILKQFDMINCKCVKVRIVPGCKLNRDVEGDIVDSTRYKQLVGSLMYITSTRPDMMYVVSLISRYMSEHTQMHWLASKRILRYLQGTVNFGIMYKTGGSTYLLVFTDSDYAGDLEDRKSTS